MSSWYALGAEPLALDRVATGTRSRPARTACTRRPARRTAPSSRRDCARPYSASAAARARASAAARASAFDSSSFPDCTMSLRMKDRSPRADADAGPFSILREPDRGAVVRVVERVGLDALQLAGRVGVGVDRDEEVGAVGVGERGPLREGAGRVGLAGEQDLRVATPPRAAASAACAIASTTSFSSTPSTPCAPGSVPP